MILIVGVGEREPLQDAELGFDELQPRGFGGGPDRLNAKSLQQGQEAGMVMNVVEIVEDDEEFATGIAAA
jgi:hypothetical protein